MSAPDLSPDELLAAEYVLGLLEGEPLLRARSRLAGDIDFAAAIQSWEAHLAPLLDELGDDDPGPELWERIERHIADRDAPPPKARSGEVVKLRRRLRYWQVGTATALAASIAALVFAFLSLSRTPTTLPGATATGAPLVASIPIADTPLRLAVTYIPERRELLVSAAGLAADGVHDHELWLIPDEGALRSLGLVKPGEATRVALEPAIASLIRAGSELVLTREPLGGKPPAAEAGPVVAEGTFVRT